MSNLFDAGLKPQDQGLEFPICFYDSKESEYFCFNDGGHVTRVSLRGLSITTDNHIYQVLSEEAFKRWLMDKFGRPPHRELVSFEEFKHNLYGCVDHICFTLNDKRPYFTDEQRQQILTNLKINQA